MLRVAIVGCGKIADAHASQIRRIPGCEITAVCDREELMAKQLCERFGVGRRYDNLEELLETSQPHVVHITTPPQSHFALGKRCLEHGCHVYIEKPFTLNTAEARALIALAEDKRRHVTAGHDDQFSHAARRMRHLVQEGYLGGPPVHMESYYCYDLGGSSYATALLGDKSHWVRKLPGGLFQNVISHGIARIAEFLNTQIVRVDCVGFVSPFLRRVGEEEIMDEVRVTISDSSSVTAYLTFSSQMRPSLHQFRVFGPRNGLVLDEDQQTVIKLRGNRMKSYAEKFLPPMLFASDYLGNAFRNLRLFASADFHMKSGMKFLIQSFYASITEGVPLPISSREIILTSEIMDAIVAQLKLGTQRRYDGLGASASDASNSLAQNESASVTQADSIG